MQRFRNGLLTLTVSVAIVGLTSGCLATRKYTRNEIKASSDALDSKLTAQIDATNGQVKETQDSVNRVNTRVTAVDQRVTTVDQKIDTQIAGVNTKVTEVDGRVTQTNTAVTGLRTDVTGVRTAGETTNRNLTALDQRFQNRNNYAMSTQKNVLFKFDSATLTDEGKAALDEIAGSMSNPDAILVLEGHTDNRGDKVYNIRLGERRVEAVKRYLAVDKGVPVYKIEEISFGADKPVAPNDSKEGREQNRSVTLTIMTPAGGPATASR
jgi:outer membrane protein OmpA-like peptidoglycan-associated protein